MKFDQYQYAHKFASLSSSTHDENVKNIFQWVKDGKIDPKQMEALIVESYKVHIY